MKIQQIPSWALWLAKDEDERCWAYEVEPLQFHKGWYENELGRNAFVSCPNCFQQKKWQDALISIKELNMYS